MENDSILGSIPGERELARTRANSSELARTPRELANGSPTPSVRRTLADVRRSTPNVRRSSAEFARVRPSSPALRRELANGSPKNSFAGKNLPTSNGRSRRTTSAANLFAANVKFGERVRQNFLTYGIIVRYREQVRHPRTNVRRELLLMFAANQCSPRTNVRGCQTCSP